MTYDFSVGDPVWVACEVCRDGGPYLLFSIAAPGGGCYKGRVSVDHVHSAPVVGPSWEPGSIKGFVVQISPGGASAEVNLPDNENAEICVGLLTPRVVIPRLV